MNFGLATGFIGLFDTARDYTSQFTITHTHTSIHNHVFSSRCLVADSNDGRSPSSRFSNSPRPQLPASHGNSSQRLYLSCSLILWLTQRNSLLANCPAHNISAGTTTRKHRSSVAVYRPLSSCLFRSRWLATDLHITIYTEMQSISSRKCIESTFYDG
jgi:hypothetical protein